MCLFGDLCEWLVALNPTLTAVLFTLNKITTQLALFVIAFDTLSGGIYKWSGTETTVSWRLFSTLTRQWEETCPAISCAPSVLWIKVIHGLDQLGNSKEPWVLHVLKLNEFCKLERKIPQLKYLMMHHQNDVVHLFWIGSLGLCICNSTSQIDGYYMFCSCALWKQWSKRRSDAFLDRNFWVCRIANWEWSRFCRALLRLQDSVCVNNKNK